MPCRNDKANARHSRLCEVNYPYTRVADSNLVRATHTKDCTLHPLMVPANKVDQQLSFEANMNLVSLSEFDALMDDNARFGTYCPRQKGTSQHFCVDMGRKTVDGRRLSWLWVFPDGNIRPAHKVLAEKPSLIWTKQDIITAYRNANNKTLPMWTRHVDTYSELAITFCLPFH